MSTLSKKAKTSALELVEDPVVQHNFELVSKQLKEITALLKGDNYMESPSTEATTTVTSTSRVAVNPLRLNFTSNGGRIQVGLKPRYNDGNFIGLVEVGPNNLNTLAGGIIEIFRNGSPIYASPLFLSVSVAGATHAVGIPPNAWFTFDKPGPGPHVYHVVASVSPSGSFLLLNYCVLYAKEFLG